MFGSIRIIFICFIIGTLNLYPNPSIKETLKQIPLADQVDLSHFFKNLLAQGNFSLTLFGYRPASLFTHEHGITLKVFSPKNRVSYLIEHKGWKLWEKYQGLFPMSKFIFHKIPSLEEYASYTILFVNKQKVVETVEKYPDIFPDKNNVEKILNHVFVQNHFKDPNYHFLQGILLGYGLENAKAFQEMLEVDNTLDYLPYEIGEKSLGFFPFKPRLVNGYPSDLIKKREFYQQNFPIELIWSTDNPFFCSKPCGYRAFYLPTAKEMKTYQKKIIGLYNSDTFLEDILTLLTQ